MTARIEVGQIVPAGTARAPRGTRLVRVYQSKDRRDKGAKRFRWRLRYQDKILSDSGQSYATRPSALAAARTNAVPVGTFPVVLEYERYRGGKLELVWERVR